MSLFAGLLAIGAAVGAGCESSSETLQGGTAASDPGGPGSGGMGGDLFMNGGNGAGMCVGLECKQVDCPGGEKTTVTGTVYAPEGTLPLYNVLVYVPNAPLDPITDGASCDQCGQVSGEPLVTALTDTHGEFVLEDVPVGDDIPVVIQIGKWRKEISIGTVAQCVDNPVGDSTLTTLPSNQSEGHIPKLALTTGGADPLECLLRKIGLDPEEFTLSSGSGRVNLFHGNGGTGQYDNSMNGGAPLEQAQPFWSDLGTLMSYDIVLLACEGDQNGGEKSQAARQAMQDYANAGGRIFMSHWHNVWLEQGPGNWPNVAAWDFQGDPPQPYTGIVDQGFPKGLAMADWLLFVGASSVLGELPISAPQHTLDTVDTALATRWIYGQSPDAGSVKYFSFNAPMGAPDDQLCGRVVFSDIHVSSGDQVGSDFPNGCTTQGLTPQEKALVFMLFDLSACITPDDEPPIPPPT
jgi:hypothetical protein